MVKQATHDEDERDPFFENTPSALDDKTHAELMLMHGEASRNLLFAKNIQWRSVGSALIVFAGCIAISRFISADADFARVLSGLIILLTCGVIFVLIMYQFWQFNEISRLREIDAQFSSLYVKISNLKSRREANAHRYTILACMIAIVILGAVIASLAIEQVLSLNLKHK